MIERLRNSWTYRSAGLYRRLVRWRPIPVGPKPTQDLLYLTLGGAPHLDMMEASIRSLAATWNTLPRLRIVLADETPAGEVERRFAFWPARKEVVSWKSAAAWGFGGLGKDLAQFAEREPMGRKMAAVLQAASEGAVLYADVDILWFREPESLTAWRSRPAPFLAMSTDMVAAYDPRVVEGWSQELASPPYYCAGVMFAAGVPEFLPDDYEALSLAAESGIGLTEQTLFAKWTRRSGGNRFPESEIFLSDSDRLARQPTHVGMPWAARHYVGPVRHLFWRDALQLAKCAEPITRNGSAMLDF